MRYALSFAVGLVVTAIGFALFRHGYGPEALVLMFGSGAGIGWWIGIGEETAPADPEECAAPEGANVVSLRNMGKVS